MITVSIAIAAYNAEKNIAHLLESIRRQIEKNWKLDQLIIHSDCSEDNTVALIKKSKNKRLCLIDNRNRIGFAGSVKTLLSKSSSDITILLNDDIKISDFRFIEKIVNAFNTTKNIGLVTVRPVALPPRTHIERSVIVSIDAYENTLYSNNAYQNIFTCDGKVMAISRKFKAKLTFPKKLEKMGNVDSYIYLSCIKLGFKYFHEKKAQVYFRCPSTIKDWIRWTSRNNADKMILESTFGSLAAKEFEFPDTRKLLMNKVMQFVKHPIESTIALMVGVYASRKAKLHKMWLTPTWEIVTTSKLIGR